MQYLALIYAAPENEPVYGTPEFGAMMAGYNAFTAMLKANGSFVSGEGLKPATTATSVRVKQGKVETMDGPFAETKEHLGGYYLMEVPDLDTAIRYAAQIPTAGYGTVELRPITVW
ncbi:MAG: YciI family protein [Alphaproteobacteria bacterium]